VVVGARFKTMVVSHEIEVILVISVDYCTFQTLSIELQQNIQCLCCRLH